MSRKTKSKSLDLIASFCTFTFAGHAQNQQNQCNQENALNKPATSHIVVFIVTITGQLKKKNNRKYIISLTRLLCDLLYTDEQLT